MKQEGLNRQIGILQKMEFDLELLTPSMNYIPMGLNDLINWYQSHGALDLGSTSLGNMISMKNEGTAQVHEGTAQVNESTAEKIKVPLLFVKVPLVLSDILERCISTEDPYLILTKRGRRLQGDDYISTSGEALAL
ncbi:hypothetical protein Tco_0582649 [Tanacetum coccineum]